MVKKFIIMALVFAVAACHSQPKRQVVVNIVNEDGTPIDVSPSAGGKSPKALISGSTPELTQLIQNGAIKSGDLYYMPIGKDNTGCQYYTSFATGKVTLTAVYYKQANGTFTNDRAGAVCN
jgi:hypothetical protein